MNFDFFPYCGIHRPVSLLVLPCRASIERIVVATALPADGDGPAMVYVRGTVVLSGPCEMRLSLAREPAVSPVTAAVAPAVPDSRAPCEFEARLEIPVLVTRAVHPRALAISNSLGHYQYTAVARAERASSSGSEAAGMDPVGLRDADWERNMWWEDRSGGDPTKWEQNTGNGWAQNNVLPISPDPISGQQAFNSTVVRVTKVT